MIELVTASCVRVRGSVWGYGIEHARAGGAARKAGTKGRRLLVYGGTRIDPLLLSPRFRAMAEHTVENCLPPNCHANRFMGLPSSAGNN